MQYSMTHRMSEALSKLGTSSKADDNNSDDEDDKHRLWMDRFARRRRDILIISLLVETLVDEDEHKECRLEIVVVERMDCPGFA